MTVTTATQPASSVLGSPHDELCLRVVGARHDSRLVRIASNKCTIGSGAGCTLRIRARGVHRISCFVVRGNRGTVVRNWSGDTRLNGRIFTDAALSVGDRLRCGPVEFEVIAPPTGGLPEHSRSAAVLDSIAAETDEQLSTLLQEREELACARQELDAVRQKIDSEANELNSRLAELRSERAAWEVRLATERETLDARFTEFDETQAAWTQFRQSEADQITVERNELSRLYNDLTIRHDELTLRESQLTEQHQQLHEANEAIQQSTRHFDQNRTEYETKLEARERTLNDQSLSLEQAMLDWQRDRQAEEQQLLGLRESLTADKAALQSEREALDKARRQLEIDRESQVALQKSLADRERESHLSLADSSAMDTLIAELEQRRRTFEFDFQRHHADLDASRAALDAKSTEVESRLAMIAAKEQQHESRSSECERLEADLNARLQQVAEEQSKLQSLRAEIELREQAIASQDLEATSREASLQSLQSELEAIRQSLDADRERLQADLTKLASRQQALESEAAEIGSRRLSVEEERSILAEQADRLNAEWTKLQEAQTKLECSNQTAELDQLRAEVAERDQSLLKLHESISQLEQALAAAQTAQQAPAEQDVSDSLAELERTKNEQLERRQVELDQQQRAIDRQRLDLEARLEAETEAHREFELTQSERRASLDNREAELEKTRAELVAEQARLAADRADLVEPSKTAAEREQSSQGTSENSSDDGVFERLRRMTQANDATEDAAKEDSSSATDTATSTHEENVQVSEAYSRFKQSMSGQNDEEIEAPQPKTTPQAKSSPTDAPSTASPSSGDEESIEDYMARLMQRVRGEETPLSNDRGSAPPEMKNPEPVVSVATPATDVSDVDEAEVPAGSRGPVEMVARAQPPEKNELARMRELANSEARTAIEKSTRKQTAHEVTNRWIVVGVSLTTTAVMGYMGWGGNRMALLGMCAGLAVSIYYSGRACWSVRGFFAKHATAIRRRMPTKQNDGESNN